MRNVLVIGVTGMMLLSLQVQAEELQMLKTPMEKTSYAIGVDLVRNFKRQAIDADLAAVIRGMQEESAGKKLLMSEPEIRSTLDVYQLELKNRQAQLRQKTAENNKNAGAAFLAANKDKEGVVTLPSGLQYKVLKAGKGKNPGDDDGVTCRYRGTLLDGTEFDNSDTMGMPVTFLSQMGQRPSCGEAGATGGFGAAFADGGTLTVGLGGAIFGGGALMGTGGAGCVTTAGGSFASPCLTRSLKRIVIFPQ